MKQQSIEMFGRFHRYSFTFDIKQDIEVLTELAKKVRLPFILSYAGLETVDFYIYNDDQFAGNDCIRWLYDQTKDATGMDGDIRGCVLSNSIEDAEWTAKRNEGLTGIFYRRAIFKPDVQDMLVAQIEKYKEAAETLFAESVAEEEKEAATRAARKAEWVQQKTYTNIKPRGGEDGTDGYVDAVYRDTSSGEDIRMVNRDIFDFGCYSYPKRVEGTEDVLKRDNWTDDEKRLSKWIAEFGGFHGIRM